MKTGLSTLGGLAPSLGPHVLCACLPSLFSSSKCVVSIKLEKVFECRSDWCYSYISVKVYIYFLNSFKRQNSFQEIY